MNGAPQSSYGTAAMALAATLGVQAVVAMALLTVPVFAPQAAQTLGIDPSRVGFFAAIAYMGASTAALLGGAIVPRWGAILISQVGLVLCALGLVLVAAGVLPLIVVAALIMGIGYGPSTPASSHVLARHSPPKIVALMFSIKQSGVPLGGAMAGIAVPPLTLAFGWQGAALAVAGICLLAAMAVAPARARLDDDRRPGEARYRVSLIGPLRLVFGRSDLRRFALCSFFFAAVQQCLSVFFVTYLTTDLEYGLVAAGLVLAVSQASGIVGRIVWGIVDDWLKRSRRLLAALSIAMAASSLALGLVAPSWPVAAVAVVAASYGLTGVGWNGVFLAEVARMAGKEDASRATGGVLFVTFTGVVVSPPLFGALALLSGSYGTGFVVLAAAVTLCGLALWPEPPRPHAP